MQQNYKVNIEPMTTNTNCTDVFDSGELRPDGVWIYADIRAACVLFL